MISNNVIAVQKPASNEINAATYEKDGTFKRRSPQKPLQSNICASLFMLLMKARTREFTFHYSLVIGLKKNLFRGRSRVVYDAFSIKEQGTTPFWTFENLAKRTAGRQ